MEVLQNHLNTYENVKQFLFDFKKTIIFVYCSLYDPKVNSFSYIYYDQKGDYSLKDIKVKPNYPSQELDFANILDKKKTSTKPNQTKPNNEDQLFKDSNDNDNIFWKFRESLYSLVYCKYLYGESCNYAPLISVFSNLDKIDTKERNEKMEEICVLLENCTFCIKFFQRKKIKSHLEFAKGLRNISNFQLKITELKKIIVKNSQQQKQVLNKWFNQKDNAFDFIKSCKKQTKYLLAKIEQRMFLEQKMTPKRIWELLDDTCFEIEHIFPQSIDQKTEWEKIKESYCKSFSGKYQGTKAYYIQLFEESIVKDIGNFILLSPDENKNSGNKDLKEKIKEYKRSDLRLPHLICDLFDKEKKTGNFTKTKFQKLNSEYKKKLFEYACMIWNSRLESFKNEVEVEDEVFTNTELSAIRKISIHEGLIQILKLKYLDPSDLHTKVRFFDGLIINSDVKENDFYGCLADQLYGITCMKDTVEKEIKEFLKVVEKKKKFEKLKEKIPLLFVKNNLLTSEIIKNYAISYQIFILVSFLFRVKIKLFFEHKNKMTADCSIECYETKKMNRYSECVFGMIDGKNAVYSIIFDIDRQRNNYRRELYISFNKMYFEIDAHFGDSQYSIDKFINNNSKVISSCKMPKTVIANSIGKNLGPMWFLKQKRSEKKVNSKKKKKSRLENNFLKNFLFQVLPDTKRKTKKDFPFPFFISKNECVTFYQIAEGGSLNKISEKHQKENGGSRVHKRRIKEISGEVSNKDLKKRKIEVEEDEKMEN